MVYLNDDIAGFDFEAALPLLSPQRREQALRFSHELGRKTCAAAYLLLRQALEREYGIDSAPLFEYGEHGKPRLAGMPHIHFSLSHCRQAVACVVSDRPVGIDIESIGRYSDALARYTMNAAELDAIGRASRPDVAFVRLWTQKEAVLKLSGRGISGDMKDVLTGREQLETTVDPAGRYVYTVAR